MSSTNQSLKRLKTGRFVTNHHVNTLRKNYEEKRWVENSKRIGKPDWLSVWYGLDDLKYFLDIAQKSGADGVRLYFGVYPSSYPENILREDHQTIVLVATKQQKNAKGKTENEDLYVPTPEGPQMIAFNICIPRPSAPSGNEGTILENIPLFEHPNQ